MDPNPTAQNGETCTTEVGGRLATEMQGVSARDGECLINYDGAFAGDAHGVATPQQAIKRAGFGRFTLSSSQPEHALDGLLYFYETDGQRRIGLYRVQHMSDGSFILHGVVASTPMKKKRDG